MEIQVILDDWQLPDDDLPGNQSGINKCSLCKCISDEEHNSVSRHTAVQTNLPPIEYHRLRGSASPVLTATHHSYGSLAWLSDFFSGPPLEVRPPNRFWRKMARTTCIHARLCLLQ